MIPISKESSVTFDKGFCYNRWTVFQGLLIFIFVIFVWKIDE